MTPEDKQFLLTELKALDKVRQRFVVVPFPRPWPVWKDMLNPNVLNANPRYLQITYQQHGGSFFSKEELVEFLQEETELAQSTLEMHEKASNDPESVYYAP